jgi:hypothetical protein
MIFLLPLCPLILTNEIRLFLGLKSKNALTSSQQSISLPVKEEKKV